MMSFPRLPALLSAALAGISPPLAAPLIAADGTLPSIFAAPSEPTPAPRPFFPSAQPVSPLSAQLRSQILAGGLRGDRVISYDPTPVTLPAPVMNVVAEDTEVITMDRFIVRAEKAPVVLRPVGPPRPFRDALRTGKLYHSVGTRFTTDVSIWSSNMGSPTSSSPANGSRLAPTIPRVELAIRFSW